MERLDLTERTEEFQEQRREILGEHGGFLRADPSIYFGKEIPEPRKYVPRPFERFYYRTRNLMTR